jgi:hypothetical protein
MGVVLGYFGFPFFFPSCDLMAGLVLLFCFHFVYAELGSVLSLVDY